MVSDMEAVSAVWIITPSSPSNGRAPSPVNLKTIAQNKIIKK